MAAGITMNKNKLKKEKWTLNVDQRIKGVVVKEAKRRGIYPVQFIESLVREKFNPFGHSEIDDEVGYVRKLRKPNIPENDQTFIEEIRRWEKINS
jgi:hypothetical protein